MIDYTPFWETLKRQHESWYTMTRNHNVGFSTLHRLKNNKDISTKTINDLCKKLNCRVEDIVRYIPSDTDQILWKNWYLAYTAFVTKEGTTLSTNFFILWNISILIFCCGYAIYLTSNYKFFYIFSYNISYLPVYCQLFFL